ncbi:MAG TPA: toll/interleukin-1 receptor domain-containing protein, partial [Caulobacteraceae bacterium]|nr:toll/interleukin-1 receptor domain-containing protein [Caulobacteraceae bacterium]
MSYVFISYKREDETRVGRIARSLERAGVEVWWDRGLPGGESWQANIEAKLAGAGCVVVAWSHGSVGPEGQYVRDEARRGLARGVLVPVLIDRLDALPLGFGETQAIDLSHWRGADQDPFLQDLIAAVRAKLAGAPAPAPRGPTGRLRRRLALSGVASFGAVVLCAL